MCFSIGWDECSTIKRQMKTIWPTRGWTGSFGRRPRIRYQQRGCENIARANNTLQRLFVFFDKTDGWIRLCMFVVSFVCCLHICGIILKLSEPSRFIENRPGWSGAIPDCPRQFKVILGVPRWSRTVQDDPRQFKMILGVPRWSRTVQNDPRQFKRILGVPSDPGRSKMIQNNSKWSWAFQDDTGLSRMIQNCNKWSRTVQNDPGLSKMIQNNSKWWNNPEL